MALLGFALREPFIASNVSEELKSKFQWISNAILRNTPCTSVHIFKKKEKEGVILLSQAGVVSADPLKFPPSLPTKQPILQGIISEEEREVYLPDLQILPGKIEFTYLPLNCQSVLMLAAGEYIIVVGTNQAKVLKQEDLTRIRTLSYILKEIV